MTGDGMNWEVRSPWTRRLLLGGIAAGLSAGACGFADRPIVVVAYAAGHRRPGRHGGGMAVAEPRHTGSGENQGGAGGAIAARAVSRAAPDGTTILLAGNAIFAILPHIAMSATIPSPATASPASANRSGCSRCATLPVTTLAELVECERNRQAQLRLLGRQVDAACDDRMFRRSGFDAAHPFRGSAPGVQAMLSGDVDFMIDTVVISMCSRGLRGRRPWATAACRNCPISRPWPNKAIRMSAPRAGRR